jgi:hypothetical protein
MKPIALLIATSVLSTATQAADYGLGVTLSTSSEIFVPINLSSELRIEPSVALNRSEFKSSTGNITTTSGTYNVKTGVFSIRPVGEGFNILAGGRLGYQKLVQRRTDFDFAQDQTTSGYIVEPTLAVEYLPFKQLALGAEASLFYSRLKPRSDQGFSLTETGTVTKVTVKYFY